MKHEYHTKIRFGDTDAAGIMYYPNFYRRMDESTHELFGAAGYSVSVLQSKEDIILPILEASCQFHEPLYFEDRATICSEVTKVDRKVFRIDHTFKKGDRLIAEGYEVRAWTSVKENIPKAIPIPDHIKTILKS
ncbi:acyl-CoA thioesterase [Alteribacillus iranensis]|uniref:Acyl-CoA thioester hydrolase n=1 Tax=Alteribacillus iranensis TaxID=930128 RepID=A0A1I2EV85_9BACI|nr:thioesterase family protein [Alteribacillus iranensis]SFE97002.1 acyl-CoA thioester hydrolase [Alteribacillus iranensis]